MHNLGTQTFHTQTRTRTHQKTLIACRGQITLSLWENDRWQSDRAGQVSGKLMHRISSFCGRQVYGCGETFLNIDLNVYLGFWVQILVHPFPLPDGVCHRGCTARVLHAQPSSKTPHPSLLVALMRSHLIRPLLMDNNWSSIRYNSTTVVVHLFFILYYLSGSIRADITS